MVVYELASCILDNSPTIVLFIVTLVLVRKFFPDNCSNSNNEDKSYNNNSSYVHNNNYSSNNNSSDSQENLYKNKKRRGNHPNNKLPPGPWLCPLLGYIPLLFCRDKRDVFRQLRKKFGDLVYIRMGCRPMVIASGHQMIQEVLVKHSKEFEGRPQVFTTLKPGQGKAVVNSSGPLWKEHRAFLVSQMKGLGIAKMSFEDNVFQEISLFLKFLTSKNGQSFDSRFSMQTAMSNIICHISFGKRCNYDTEEFIHILKLIESNMKLVGGTAIVNYFPFLEYLPGDLFGCKASMETVEKVQKMTRAWVDDHKSTFDPDNPRDIIDLYLLEMQRKTDKDESTLMDESQLIKLVGDLLVAGTETTATTLLWMALFLVRHPEVQEKLYEEIVTVTGGPKDHDHVESSISFQDKEKMPYTRATILESQRLADIAPFSLPHSNPETVYDLAGYTIPKGTMVLPMLNSLHHSPDVWENPMDFVPERFLDESRQKVVNHKDILPFSAGSRVCPGKPLAAMELFCFITSIVQKFKLLPGDDEGILPPLEGHIGVTYVPNAFKLRFVPRS